jgi:type IX secretion system PorP/SprF family membrane protein
MKYTVLLFTLCITVCFNARAQQDPLYAQYLNNPFVINPAYGGMTQNLNTTLSYRYQWAGFEGSPKTINANGHISLANNKMGAGLILLSDQLGANSTNELFATYSYHLPLDNRYTLSFGLQGGVSNYQINNDKINAQNKTDPFFQGTVSKIAPNLGMGLILSSDRLMLGISVPRIY